ncbi:MAG: CDP-alcohol phosphatidyltransferase family protein [Parachlamydiaceae bacterium]|nr:CDP-alcohol phosphatidyltransferase family protein [Parachlamydiaceae bacterium]
MDTKKLKKIALLPNAVTAFGLSCGLFVIFKMNMIGIGEVNEQVLVAVTLILLLAAFADLLDGAIARVIKAESEFGSLFDSLADAISFGVAPCVIVLKSLSILPGSKLSFLATAAALIFSLCGVMRLVRFNVSALAAKLNADLALEHKKHFTGLPIPAAAAAIVSLNLFLYSQEFLSTFSISKITQTWILSLAMILLGYCMISRWKFPSIKTLRIRVKSFQALFLTVVIAVFILYGVLHFFALVSMVLSWSYVIIAWILSIIRLIAGRKSKTLEDFEPEPDDFDDDDE